jgi:uncharacterized protein (DUF488 family)
VSRRARTVVFTIGHSNRPVDAFIAALAAHRIERLVDIRAFPHSRAQPQFDQAALAESLRREGIAYEHAPALGGRRRRDRSVGDEVNGAWENASFHAYADYALSRDFTDALDDLVANATDVRTAIMCAEAVWWRCHRRIVTDHLLARGVDVVHVMDATKAESATLSPHARVKNGSVTYPSLLGSSVPRREHDG